MKKETKVSYRQTAINVDEYRVLYDQPEYPASNASCAWQHGRHWMTLQEATDGQFGFVMQLTKSSDMGHTWSVPVPFGPPIAASIALAFDLEPASRAHVVWTASGTQF